MSFFDDASLVFLPSGQAGKDGKAYSMKPTDGSGDFTFSRGSNLTATRIDSNGLIEKGRENLLLQSNQFDTTWALSDTSVTSGQSGYDGSSDAWKLSSNSAGTNRRISQTKSQNSIVTFSVYAKAGTYSGRLYLRAAGDQNYRAYFDLSNGTTDGGTNLLTSKSTFVGNDWYRYEATWNLGTGSGFDIRFGDATIAGDYFYIQDAQLEIGLVATEYIESGATTGLAGILEDSPRFDYSGGASCPSLLLEGSRTNQIRLSEYFEDTTNYDLRSADITTNYATSPEGLVNATKAIPQNETTDFRIQTQNTFGVSGDNVLSVFAKYESGGFQYLVLATNSLFQTYAFDIRFGTKVGNAGGGTIADADTTIEDYGNGWYRCSIKSNNTGHARGVIYLSDDGTNTTATGDGSKGMLIYGFQGEQSVSYPTSYIPNHSGGSVTRGADVCSNSTGGVSQTEGTIFIDYKDSPNKDVLFACSTSSGLITNNIRLSYNQLYIRNSTGNLLVASVTLPDAGKIAIKYDTNGVKIFSNGSSIYTNSTRISFDGSVDFVRIGSRVNNAGIEEFNVDQFLIFTTALPDNQCIALTS